MTRGDSSPSTRPGRRERFLIAFSLGFFRIFGPLIRGAIQRGIAGPNVLVTVRGRRTGRSELRPKG